jgi:uncharacterized damage-inducible protein DinB
MKEMLSEIGAEAALQKPNGQHSMLELLYHMIIWREFTISRLEPAKEMTLEYFDLHDWQDLDHQDQGLWSEGVKKMELSQQHLVSILENLHEAILPERVPERDYDYRHLFYGVVQHDIYHLGQIAYIKKLLEK